MNDFLNKYKLKICALSPIHIGNGEKIGAREYIYLDRLQKVIIPDMKKMQAALSAKGKVQSFYEYMLAEKKEPLGSWLFRQGYRTADYRAWKRYELDSADAFREEAGKSKSSRDILCFVKDAYGKPYVPGSSLKGMLRTALLAWEIQRSADSCQQVKREIREGLTPPFRVKKERYLSKEVKKLEVNTFHRLNREGTRTFDAVNDCLSGLIVSDSDPIPQEKLILCEKVDLHTDGEERVIPLFREALAPGTEIMFTISLDHTVCPYTLENILEALECFNTICYQSFYSRFKRGSDQPGTVWLGGGVGFAAKTVSYPLFGREGVRVTNEIYKNTLGNVYFKHGHAGDIAQGVSPHICKCTRYNGKLYDMGMGRIELVKE